MKQTWVEKCRPAGYVSDKNGTEITSPVITVLSSTFIRRTTIHSGDCRPRGERGGGCLVGVTWSAMACINCVVVQICTQNRCFQRRQQFVHRSLSSFICFHCRLSFDSRSLSEYCIASYSNKKRHYRGHKCIKCFSLLTLILLPT